MTFTTLADIQAMKGGKGQIGGGYDDNYTIISLFNETKNIANELVRLLLENGKQDVYLCTEKDINFKPFKYEHSKYSGNFSVQEDPDFHIDPSKIQNRNIIFLLHLEEDKRIFPQLSLINWLKCFVIPDIGIEYLVKQDPITQLQKMESYNIIW